ncbi:MAG TPA: GNAT family N-acetyltransferase [Dehalococcoidia bacterium]|nr:GNAT family N-acetyltransferase [Dehalococcoidia bacterium]
MTLEIRNLVLDDLEAAMLLDAHAFGMPLRHDISPIVAHAKTRFDTDSYLGVFEDGEMTSMMRTIPAEMYLNGGLLSLGAVSPVANSPLHRRKGHTGAMLRHSIGQMREAGQVLSGLYTPHPAFYRRYGWEVASEWRSVTFKPKDFGLTLEPSQRGRFRFLKLEDWQTLEPIFQAYAASSNGPFNRSEIWWRSYVTEVPWRQGTDIVLWQNDAGDAEGYAIYQQPSTPGPDFPTTDVNVRELIATSRDAYLNLLGYFGRHDIHHEVTIASAPHDPILALFGDAEKLEVRQGFAVMLRIVDFEAAMRARPAARSDDTAELTVRLLDDSAPWNDGVWRLGVAEGKTWAERDTGEPEITLSARSLAPLFNGYLSPSIAAWSGLIEANSGDALERAARIFAVRCPPYFTDHF